MAYAALVSTVQLLDQTAQQDPFHNLFSVKHQIKSLHDKFCFLQAFLEEVSPKGDVVIDCLEIRIREVAYQTQDIIEFNVPNQASPEKECLAPRKVKKGSWRILYAVQKAMSLRKKNVDFSVNNFEKLYQDLQNVVDEVGSIVEEVMKIKKSKKIEYDLHFSNYTSDFGSPRIIATSMVGFDEEMMEIKARLCGESSKLQIIPIIGMGGIGKTTLASNIFYDPLITYHFHIRAWITITQRYSNVREILLGLIRSMTTITEKLSRETEAGLAEFLYKSLKGRKYLIVLDDIWNTEAWDDLKMLFPDDHNGSRIILTTRLVDVAVYVNSFGHFHQMRFLNEDQSWNLLREKVFGKECCPPKLEEIGKLIAKNCQGLPLSIVVVGGLLSKVNRIKNQWENIARDVSLAVRENNEHFTSKILSLSYNHLPHHLKPCFLYLGCFPEDYEIPVFKLISLWIAEGFLKPMGSNKSLEQVAEEYLEDLVKRSLVLVTKKRSNGKFRFCSIHDLLRDLCIRKAHEENFLHVMGGIQDNIDNKRRLCFSKSVYHFTNGNTLRSPVRSVFCCYYNDRMPGFSLLRVLDVLDTTYMSFPVEILQLFHLRYLAFTSRFIRSSCILPPSLSKLQNLQTLIVISSVTLNTGDPMLAAHLPIWKMPQLRHLIFFNITLFPFPSFNAATDEELEFSVLKNLQTLSRVRNFKFTKKAIEMIPNLKKLKLIYTGESLRQRNEYDLNNLVQLYQLETLNLKFQPSSGWWRNPVPVRFGVPLNLKKLTLCGCGLSWKDMTIIGSLANLEVLKLLNLSVIGGEWEPIEGEFCRLKFLLMEWLDIKTWLAEDVHFPSLECLIIRHCSLLENIPCGIGEISTLRVIEVDYSELAAESAKVILDEQRDMGNDVLQLRIGSSHWK